MLKRIFPFLFLIVFLPAAVSARILPLAFKVASDAAVAPVQISELNINIEVLGNIALTRYDIIFLNPNDSALEGRFSLKFNQNQTVSAFAVDGEAKTYEIKREEASYGMRSAEADDFSANLPAFAPKGFRRVQITVQEKLAVYNGFLNYYLPLFYDGKIEKFSVRADVFKQSLKPVLETAPFESFNFEKKDDSFAAFAKADNFTPAGALNFLVPVEAGAKVYTFYSGGDTYFFAAVPVARKEAGREALSQADFFWDASYGMAGSRAAYLDFLKVFFEKNKDLKINFISFSAKPAAAKSFSIRGGNWAALRKHIESLAYEGKADFEAVKNSKAKGGAVLLFSAGPEGFLQKALPDFKVKIFPVAAAAYNKKILNNIAACSGGLLLDLSEKPAEAAVDEITKRQYRLSSVTYEKNKFEDVYPARPVRAEGMVNVTGIVNLKEAPLDLNFTFDGIKTEKRRIYIDKKTRNPFARSFYAQEKAAALALEGESKKEEIINLGRKYGIATDYTGFAPQEITEPAAAESPLLF